MGRTPVIPSPTPSDFLDNPSHADVEVKQRGVTERNRDRVFDVRDYEGVPGMADATIPLNDANVACQAAGGGIVLVPGGLWRWADDINWGIAVALQGVGPASIPDGEGTGTHFQALNSTARMRFGVTSAVSDKIGGFVIDGDYGAGRAANPFFPDLMNGRAFRDIWVINADIGAIVHRCQNSAFYNVQVSRCGINWLLDRGCGGLGFYSCFSTHAEEWNLKIDETFGDGPYSVPTDIVFHQGLKERPNLDVSTIMEGNIWIRAGVSIKFDHDHTSGSNATAINSGASVLMGDAGTFPVVFFEDFNFQPGSQTTASCLKVITGEYHIRGDSSFNGAGIGIENVGGSARSTLEGAVHWGNLLTQEMSGQGPEGHWWTNTNLDGIGRCNIKGMTTAQRDAMNGKRIGDIIFNTTTQKLELWQGGAWLTVGP